MDTHLSKVMRTFLLVSQKCGNETKDWNWKNPTQDCKAMNILLSERETFTKFVISEAISPEIYQKELFINLLPGGLGLIETYEMAIKKINEMSGGGSMSGGGAELDNFINEVKTAVQDEYASKMSYWNTKWAEIRNSVSASSGTTLVPPPRPTIGSTPRPTIGSTHRTSTGSPDSDLLEPLNIQENIPETSSGEETEDFRLDQRNQIQT